MKSFDNYKISKGKEWKEKVTKSNDKKKNKIENVVIYVGLMEWCTKEQRLKGKKGKKYQKGFQQMLHTLYCVKKPSKRGKTSTVICMTRVKYT